LSPIGGSAGGTTGGPAGAFKWYTGSCGGTLIGSGNTINVTPTANTIYYVRGEACESASYPACATILLALNPQPTPPTLNVKSPNVTAVCASTSVNATANAGTGGTGCSDIYQFSINNGSTWSSYTPGNAINTSTAGGSTVIVQGMRQGCTSGAGL